MIPPEPIRILEVSLASLTINNSGADPAIIVELWCSATQNLWKPKFSAILTNFMVFASASEAVDPFGTIDWSRMLNRIITFI
jgi:hypothetical protein